MAEHPRVGHRSPSAARAPASVSRRWATASTVAGTPSIEEDYHFIHQRDLVTPALKAGGRRSEGEEADLQNTGGGWRRPAESLSGQGTLPIPASWPTIPTAVPRSRRGHVIPLSTAPPPSALPARHSGGSRPLCTSIPFCDVDMTNYRQRREDAGGLGERMGLEEKTGALVSLKGRE